MPDAVHVTALVDACRAISSPSVQCASMATKALPQTSRDRGDAAADLSHRPRRSAIAAIRALLSETRSRRPVHYPLFVAAVKGSARSGRCPRLQMVVDESCARRSDKADGVPGSVFGLPEG